MSGFSEFKKVKVGLKTLEDATLDLGTFRNQDNIKVNYVDKPTVYNAIINKRVNELRAISKFFYDTNGIYQRVCNYFAFLYRYDWYLEPQVFDKDIKQEKLLKDFSKALNFLDNSYIRKLCGDIALTVMKEGCYYGYLVPSKTGIALQQLPPSYCRVRYHVGAEPAVEFNMRYFDTFPDITYRMRVLDLFPDEFKKGYLLYKKGKLPPDVRGETGGWYLLTVGNCVKFNFNNTDIPMFISAIPTMIDLDAAQDLDRRKQMQKLLKILVQKLPMDKNGDLIFDNDEARDIHNNAVLMLKRAIGVDVLTTFADIEAIDMSDGTTTTAKDDLEKMERTVYNALGVSRNLFNTDGNLSLEKSILTDEATVRGLLLQFEMFFDKISHQLVSSKKYSFKFNMLETTQFNYREIAKLYKEQTQLGYSKMLPQIALGHSQSFILNTITFENDYLHLSEIMIPPMSSNTMSSSTILGKNEKLSSNKTQNNTEGKTVGRPQKADDQKSEKTIKNKESMS